LKSETQSVAKSLGLDGSNREGSRGVKMSGTKTYARTTPMVATAVSKISRVFRERFIETTPQV
jgi:hypothetical protein